MEKDTSQDVSIAEIKKDTQHIIEKLDSMKVEVKENTKFRIQAKTIIGFVSFFSAALGGFIMWVVSRIRGIL